jgi:hypothetical protein
MLTKVCLEGHVDFLGKIMYVWLKLEVQYYKILPINVHIDFSSRRVAEIRKQGMEQITSRKISECHR